MARKEIHDEELVAKVAAHYKAILELIGEDPEREGLLKTPARAAKALIDCTCGYKQDAVTIGKKAVFEHCGSQVITVRDIEFYSFCEHHILPFFGKISVAYIPKGKMLGLSKLARIVDVYARRLQVQERLTAQVCDVINKVMPTDGVLVYCEAQHLCMKMRGVEKQDSSTVTIDYNGRFATDPTLRAETLSMMK